MLNFPVKYKIVFTDEKTGVIASDHKNKKLIISKDIKLRITDDGKLCAMFPNLNSQEKSSGVSIPFLSKIPSDTDCSVVISDPSVFNYCVRKNGAYMLSGEKVKFTGTDKDEALFLYKLQNSEINLGGGNDTILYKESLLRDNNINLGDGDNLFAAMYHTDADRPLVNNKISFGDGNDFVYLRNSYNNNVHTWGGDDTVKIECITHGKYSNRFNNNTIITGNGNDDVDVSGDFLSFCNNEFYLGKGSDNFRASINPDDDATSSYDYGCKVSKFASIVSNNKIFAQDGAKGFFEKNTFLTSTHNANQLSPNTSTTAYVEGFQELESKPVPETIVAVAEPQETPLKTKTSVRENCERRYHINSLGAMLFRDAKMQEEAFNALQDYVQAMLEE